MGQFKGYETNNHSPHLGPLVTRSYPQNKKVWVHLLNR
jgi:hypothetical protein